MWVVPPPSRLAQQYSARVYQERKRLLAQMSRRAERYLQRLGREAAAAYRATATGGGDAATEAIGDAFVDAAISLDDVRLLEALTPQYRLATVAMERTLSRTYGMAATADLQPILDAAGQRIVTINGTARDVVRAQLRVAIRRGLPNAQTEQLIRGAVGHVYRAERIARTESAFATNEAASQIYGKEGIDQVEVLDGPDCGWTSHDDPLKADGRVVSVAEARRQPISHPNCVRAFAPLV